MTVGRLAIFVIAFCLAVIATLAQLDQQTRIAPQYAAMVPPDFSGNAARERSKLALNLGNPSEALAEARKQLALRPMPAESLTVLALAALDAGEADTARKALESASRRGWREPISQLASGEAALKQGANAVAAQRITALLATGNLEEPALGLLTRLIQTPEGRAAFAERLAAYGRWQNNALLSAGRFADPVDWARTLALAMQKGATFKCERLRLLAQSYHREGHEEAAALFWPGNCPAY